MGLSSDDLQAIRAIVREENKALKNDVKEIYRILARQEQGIFAIASQAGAKLPRSFMKP